MAYPKAIFFSMASEVAERFGYYGCLMLLTFFLRDHFFQSDSTAKLWLHAFVALSNLTPILGSVFSDMWFGPYKVVNFVTILYCLGPLMVTLGSGMFGDPVGKILAVLGLFIVGCASGCRKPCAAAFAADQFPEHMTKERQQFFSYFYLAITVGMISAQICMPYLRAGLTCLSMDTCYPVAFGSIGLALVATMLIFLSGTPWYVRSYRKNDVIWRACRCMFESAKRCLVFRIKKLRGNQKLLRQTRPGFLQRSVSQFGAPFVDEVQRVVDISILFIPTIVYWAMYDQMYSTWLIQTDAMDGRLGWLNILPDHLSVAYSIAMIFMIPFMDHFVYPMMQKLGLLCNQLQKMGLGFFLAALSFLMAALLQLWINYTVNESTHAGYHKIISSNMAQHVFDHPYLNISIDPMSKNVFLGEKHQKQLHDHDNILLHDNDMLYIYWDNETAPEKYQFTKRKPKTGYAELTIFMHPAIYQENRRVLFTLTSYNETRVQEFVLKSRNFTTNRDDVFQIKIPLFTFDDYDVILDLCNLDCKSFTIGKNLVLCFSVFVISFEKSNE